MTLINFIYLIPILIIFIYIFSRKQEQEDIEDYIYTSKHENRYVPASRKDSFIRRYTPTILLIVLFTMPFWFGPVSEFLLPTAPTKKPPSTLKNYQLYEAKCFLVYDGDTIKVENIKYIPPAKYSVSSSDKKNTQIQYKFNPEEKVRYLGFNSPDPGRNDPETQDNRKLYINSSSKNAEFVRGKKIILLTRKDYGLRDQYERILAYVYAPKENGINIIYFGVSQKLLELDLGDTRYGSPDPELPETIEISK